MKKQLLWAGLLAFFSIHIQSTAQNLIINEFMASNNTSLADNYGQYEDWIELYNMGTGEIDIAGLYFTDNLLFPINYQIPYGNDSTKIPAGGHLVLWADNDPEQGVLHLGFNLNGNGEQIGIYTPSGNVIDSLSFDEAYSDVSYGQYPDGSGSWLYYHPGSPGDTNEAESLAAGFYDYTFPPSANNTENLPILSNLSWNIANPVSWLSLMPESGMNSGVVLLSVTQANPGSSDRSAELILSSSGMPDQTIIITQAGVPVVPVLFINEFMADNQTNLTDQAGQYEDWIEIYNTSNQSVNLGGLYLSDNFNDPEKFMIPDTYPDSVTIAPQSFIVFYADNDEEQGVRHCNFKLSKSGEELLLSVNEFALIDSISFYQQYPDMSYGRTWDAGPEWTYFDVPTPGISNANDIVEFSQDELVVFPNPFLQQISIENIPENGIIKLFALDGRMIFQKRINRGRVQTSLPDLTPGLYYLKFEGLHFGVVKKLVKK